MMQNMYEKLKSLYTKKEVTNEAIGMVPLKPIVPPERKVVQKFEDIPKEELPLALRQNFELNPLKFQEFAKTLRPHQFMAIKSLEGHDIGQINIPTGTGKTYVQKYVHVEHMLEKSKKGEKGVYVIAAHRLALCTQLFDEILELLIPCGIKADMLFVGSERYNFDKLKHKFMPYGFALADVDGERSTSANEIAQFVSNSENHVIIVSTYHSFAKLKGIEKIDVCTYDEAHTTTSDEFAQNIRAIKPQICKEFFFTATRKVMGESGGQNDKEFYGEVCYEMTPREAVECGEIVRPRMHFVNTSLGQEVDYDNVPMMVKALTEAFSQHKEKVKGLSVCPESIGAKLLVTANGLPQIHSIHESEQFQQWCKDNNVHVYIFTSDKGEFVNFEEHGRQQAMEKMKKLDDTEDAILFHYDILTEGIDLPAITGVYLLRDLQTAKLLQNIGRGARLLLTDRMRLYKGEIMPCEVDKMVKPYCWVVIPEFLATMSSREDMKDMIKTLRDEYGMPLEDIGKEDEAFGEEEHFSDRVTDQDHVAKKNPLYELNHIFEEILVEETKILVHDIQSYENYREHLVQYMKKEMGQVQ